MPIFPALGREGLQEKRISNSKQASGTQQVWVQPGIREASLGYICIKNMCGNEASWIWSMERKTLSFDHMLTSARDSRFQACIHILVESILLIGLADRLKTRVYIRTWYPGGKSQRVEATSTCEKLCCAHRPVPEIKGVQEGPWPW